MRTTKVLSARTRRRGTAGSERGAQPATDLLSAAIERIGITPEPYTHRLRKAPIADVLRHAFVSPRARHGDLLDELFDGIGEELSALGNIAESDVYSSSAFASWVVNLGERVAVARELHRRLWNAAREIAAGKGAA